MRFKLSSFILLVVFTATDSFVINNICQPKVGLSPPQHYVGSLHGAKLKNRRECSGRIDTKLYMNTNQNKKKGKDQNKKRRFAQDVKPIVSIKAPTPKPRSSPAQQEQRDEKLKIFSDPDNGRSNNNSNGKKNPMLQNDKSIEELENLMSTRWGTRLEKWTADFEEWEVVYDDDENNQNESSEKNQNRSLKSGRKLRSKPVLNPWDKEERKKLYDQKMERKKHKKEKDGLETNASVFKEAQDRQNAVLDRVRKNQERLKSQQDPKANSEIELEFYDEDDEGFEAPKPSLKIYNDEDEEMENEARDFYDNIISPRPVGGFGSSRASQSSESVNEKSSFFFNEAAASISDDKKKNDEEVIQSETKAKKKTSNEKITRRPMSDDQGRKMYLSLDQAALNAKTFVSASNNDSENASNHEESLWEDIGITNPQLQQNLKKMNCFNPLYVQDKACPSIVSGNDVLISTHTGSGKTLAFLAPLAQRILFDAESGDGDNSLGVKVIIVAPGRELASQIVSVARDLFQGTDLTAMLAIGGTPFSRNFEQIRKKKPTFIVGTPGRVAELVVGKPGDKSGKLKIASLQTIVLDECDALLEYKPHREPTAAIMDILQRRHRDSLQTVLCSATAGDLMATSKIDGYLRETFAHAQSDDNDLSITTAPTDKFSRVRVSRTAIHGVVHVPHRRFALDALRKILYTEPSPQQVLIFVDNARRVGVVVDKLAEMDIIAAPLHGGQGSEKGDRAEVNKALRDGFVGIVVATEMAARGIDAPFLTHVINLDLPTDASHYAHRAGRCGRGGRPGVVVNIAVGKREQKVPEKFANALDIEIFEAEPQKGKLVILEPNSKNKSNKDKI